VGYLFVCPVAVAAGDMDGDSFDDALDNCVEEPNPLQSDLDDDGIGDICDICPSAADDRCDVFLSGASETAEKKLVLWSETDWIGIELAPVGFLPDSTLSVTATRRQDGSLIFAVRLNGTRFTGYLRFYHAFLDGRIQMLSIDTSPPARDCPLQVVKVAGLEGTGCETFLTEARKIDLHLKRGSASGVQSLTR
jgi:hypothetical protein